MTLTMMVVVIFMVALALYLFVANRRQSRILVQRQQQLKFYRDHSFAGFLSLQGQCVLMWAAGQSVPVIYGTLDGVAEHEVADFQRWMALTSFEELHEKLEFLLREGRAFQLYGQFLQQDHNKTYFFMVGEVFNGYAMLRIENATYLHQQRAEEHQQRQKLEQKTRVWSGFFDQVGMPIWRHDQNGQTTWANRAYRKMVASTDEDAPEQLLSEATRQLVKNGPPLFHDIVSENIDGERYRFDLTHLRDDHGGMAIAVDVTAESELKAAVERLTQGYSETLDLLPTAVALFDSNMKLHFFNQAFLNLWSLDRAFLESGPSHALVIDRLREDGLIAEQPDWRGWKENLFAVYRDVETRQHVWNLPDGRTLRLLAYPNPQGGVTWLFENLTEKLGLETRYNTLIRMQGETLDHLNEAVVVFGSDGRVRLSNPAFADIWSLPPALAVENVHIMDIANHCKSLQSQHEWSRFSTWVTGFDETREAENGRMELKDGRVLDYALVPLPEGQTMLNFADVSVNVRYAETLRQNNELLLTTDKLRNDFIQHVSYELRTPLTNIIGFSDLLKTLSMGDLNERQHEYVDHISSQSLELLNIVNDILDLATVDAGIMELVVEEVDVDAVMKTAIERIHDRIDYRKIKVDCILDEDLPPFYADSGRVRQVMINLLSNAANYAPEKSHIRFEAYHENAQIVFSIHDDGCGIPDEMIDTIFKPFSSKAHHGTRAGVGLGLSIVKSFVELHGGSVEVESGKDKGTTILCRFPLQPTQQKQEQDI